MASFKICSIPNCGKLAYRRTWCSPHYQRWKRHKDPLAGSTFRHSREELSDWIKNHVNYSGCSCLIWPFARMQTGYARYYPNNYPATRVMCELVHGAPPTKKHQAAHSCGKGHLGCIHPKHLSWKTPKSNSQDMIDHGTSCRGERHGMHKLTLNEILEIRELKDKMSQHEIADLYGIKQIQVGRIINRKSWSWLK